MYVEFDDEKFGLYRPVSGPVPLHRYRAFKRRKTDERADRIRALADQFDLPINALAGSDLQLAPPAAALSLPHQPFDAEAIDILATKLRTPLQVQLHLTLALEAGYQTGEKPVTAEMVATVLSRQLDDLEPTLAHHGYRLKDMTEQFDAKAAEIRERMLAAGLPI